MGADLSSVREEEEDQELIMPRPEVWDRYVVNSYVRPKGLHAMKRKTKLSESEKIFGDRYSKRNVGLVALEKSGISICSNFRKGFKGFKGKQISKEKIVSHQNKILEQT